MYTTFTVILKDDKISKFMQAADLFDKGKVIVKIVQLNVSYMPGVIVDEEKIQCTIDTILKGYKTLKKEVIFIGHSSTTIKSNPYIDTNVRQISDGKNWSMFHEWLQRNGWNVETTEDMYVKQIINTLH